MRRTRVWPEWMAVQLQVEILFFSSSAAMNGWTVILHVFFVIKLYCFVRDKFPRCPCLSRHGRYRPGSRWGGNIQSRDTAGATRGGSSAGEAELFLLLLNFILCRWAGWAGGVSSQNSIQHSTYWQRWKRKHTGESFHGDGTAHSCPDTGWYCSCSTQLSFTVMLGNWRICSNAGNAFQELKSFKLVMRVFFFNKKIKNWSCHTSGVVCPSSGSRPQHDGHFHGLKPWPGPSFQSEHGRWSWLSS